VAGAGDDYPGIANTLASVRALVEQRRQQRAAGRRQFAPLYLVIDEAQDVLREVEGARDLVETVLRRGGKLGIHLVVGVQDRQVRTLGMEGASQLLINFGHVVTVRRLPTGRRCAQVETSEGMRELPVPALPDLNTMIAHQPAADDLLSHLLVSGIGTSENHAITSITSDEVVSPVSTSEHHQNRVAPAGITSDEIRRRIASGQSRNQVAGLLKGSRKERLEKIRQALAGGDDDTPPGAFRFLSDENEGGNHV
jgi:hypothetical protein